MTANTLTSFMQLGAQEAPGVYVMGGNVNEELTLEDSALYSLGSNPEGETFLVRVEYRDKNFSTQWAIIEANYTDVGGVIKLQRQKTRIGSLGAGQDVDFSSGADLLRFFGVVDTESIQPGPWHYVGAAGEPAFQNGWGYFGANTETVGFRKYRDTVEVKGLVRNGVDGTVVFTFPSGFRPLEIVNRETLTNSSTKIGRINITTNGDLILSNIEPSFVDISATFIT